MTILVWDTHGLENDNVKDFPLIRVELERGMAVEDCRVDIRKGFPDPLGPGGYTMSSSIRDVRMIPAWPRAQSG